jgi:hypothetical protein
MGWRDSSSFFGTPGECRSDPHREGKEPKRDAFQIDDGHAGLPMLALPLKIAGQRNIMPQ